MNGKGSPHAHEYISQIIQVMPETKQSFDVEFQKKFGIDLESVRQQFVEHLRATQGKPKLRFQGTLFDCR